VEQVNELAGVTFGLVIPPPWASITVEGPRRFHNVTSRPASTIIGQRVAVYAAAKPDTTTGGQAMELLEAAGLGPAKLRTWTTRKTLGAAIGTALVTGIVTESEDPWFVGPFALVLSERAVLAKPVALHLANHHGGIWRICP
jgi:hypothetical protein